MDEVTVQSGIRKLFNGGVALTHFLMHRESRIKSRYDDNITNHFGSAPIKEKSFANSTSECELKKASSMNGSH